MGDRKIVENGKRSSVDLKLAIAEDQKERAQACAKEIEATLKKYDCILDATIQVHGSVGKAVPMVVAK